MPPVLWPNCRCIAAHLLTATIDLLRVCEAVGDYLVCACSSLLSPWTIRDAFSSEISSQSSVGSALRRTRTTW